MNKFIRYEVILIDDQNEIKCWIKERVITIRRNSESRSPMIEIVNFDITIDRTGRQNQYVRMFVFVCLIGEAIIFERCKR